MTDDLTVLPIDAVITWVDGNDPAHKAKLNAFLGKKTEARPVGANASRFHDSGEINYCVASLLKFSPWLRTIFILTDAQSPPLMEMIANTPYADKIKLVDHRDIFSGYEQYLPTFNTRSITTMLWRIPGLAENFLYINDDFMLIQPVEPSAFFVDDKVVIRGSWKTFSENRWDKQIINLFKRLAGKPLTDEKKRKSYTAAIELAAKVLGFEKKYYDLPHNPHAWKKSILKDFYAAHPEILHANSCEKLRSSQQFVSESLMVHLAIKQKRAILDNRFKVLQLKPGEQSFHRINSKLKKADVDKNVIFVCVQTFEQASLESQELIFSWLNNRIGRIEQLSQR
ncbi:MAG: Stealth CR1 domain-containing protein [Pseudomonadota bacterium]